MSNERINNLLANGKLSLAQAEDMRAVFSNLEKIKDIKTQRPIPTGLIAASAAILLITLVAAGLTFTAAGVSGEPTSEVIQNVAQTMNQPGATGQGSATLNSASFFILFVLLPFMLLVVTWCFKTWNAIAWLDEQVTSSKAVLQAALQRRRDLLPNLFDAVKELMSFEKEVQAAASGRTSLLDEMVQDASAAQAEPDANIPFFAPRIAALMQAYPNVKSVQNMQALQDELASSENRIYAARAYYNDTVRDYNARLRRFPGFLVAGLSGLATHAYLESDPTANTPITFQP